MAQKTITTRTVDALKPGEAIWDEDVRGFGVRCQRRDKIYVVKLRVGGRQRWLTIGIHGADWTPAKARKRAQALIGKVKDGADPATIRDAEKANPTVEALMAEYLAEHVAAKRKATTVAYYRGLLTSHALPALGKVKVMDVGFGDVARLHHGLHATPYAANRVLAILAAMFSWAERKGLRPRGSNPCLSVEKYPEHERTAHLTDVELGRIGDALAAAEKSGAESPFAVAAIRLLMILGARRNEILELTWDRVDFERGCLVIQDHKTSRTKGAKEILLTAPAVEILSNLPRVEGNPYVICGDKDGEHLVNLRKPWLRIQTSAELSGVRLHDLRHAFGGAASARGIPLQGIARLLGHSRVRTSERYAKFAPDPARAAAESVGSGIAAAMAGGKAEILSFGRRR